MLVPTPFPDRRLLISHTALCCYKDPLPAAHLPSSCIQLTDFHLTTCRFYFSDSGRPLSLIIILQPTIHALLIIQPSPPI